MLFRTPWGDGRNPFVNQVPSDFDLDMIVKIMSEKGS